MLDTRAMAAARAHLDALTKPPGSLGRLEELLVWLAGVRGEGRPTFDRRAIIVCAADHGVARHGVSAWPSEVTAQMVANFASGGAAVSVLARTARAQLVVVNVGVAHDVPAAPVAGGARVIDARVARGTRDLSTDRAMTGAEVEAAMDAGARVARDLIASGVTLLAVGEMGIANTTSASALVSVMTGAEVESVTGHGAGLDEARRQHKVRVIERAIALHTPDSARPRDVLTALGGLEIAALVGVIVAAAAGRVPVILDGFITSAAALVAVAHEPHVRDFLLAAHRSPEPGHAVALERLGLRPLIELDLRLGEASGAALALLLIDAALKLRDEMATFAQAGVNGRS